MSGRSTQNTGQQIRTNGLEQTVPWVLSNVRLDSASDTREGQAGHGGITNHGIIPGVQYVAIFTAGFV